MERMVLNRLKQVVGRLHPNVFGFKSKVGTTESIAALVSKITKGRSATVVFIDLEKAFELANREVILEKLVKKGVRGQLLAWVSDYLSDRRARVKFQGSYSDYDEYENGTPQGGVLSPFLFNLIMDDIVSRDYPPPEPTWSALQTTSPKWSSDRARSRDPSAPSTS